MSLIAHLAEPAEAQSLFKQRPRYDEAEYRAIIIRFQHGDTFVMEVPAGCTPRAVRYRLGMVAHSLGFELVYPRRCPPGQVVARLERA